MVSALLRLSRTTKREARRTVSGNALVSSAKVCTLILLPSSSRVEGFSISSSPSSSGALSGKRPCAREVMHQGVSRRRSVRLASQTYAEPLGRCDLGLVESEDAERDEEEAGHDRDVQALVRLARDEGPEKD